MQVSLSTCIHGGVARCGCSEINESEISGRVGRGIVSPATGNVPCSLSILTKELQYRTSPGVARRRVAGKPLLGSAQLAAMYIARRSCRKRVNCEFVCESS